jgi:putative endonuclease
MFWKNPSGRLYVGSTDDLDRRLAEHNSQEKVPSKYTHKNGPWVLVWTQSHPTRASAMDQERQIKRMKSATWIRTNLLGKAATASLGAKSLQRP